MKSVLTWVTLVQLALFAPKLSAALLIPQSIEELTKSADVIVHGTVFSKSCQRDPEGRIYTSVELDVKEACKGNVSSNRFTIVYAGGVLGQERVVGSPQVEYEIGEEVVAFLQLNQRGEGVTLGIVQGKFHVWTDKQGGEKFAHNVFHGTPEPTETSPEKKTVVRDAALKGGLRLNDLKLRARGGKS